MGDSKVEILKNEIAQNVINNFNLQIEEVLSICESEIEKLMLLNLYRYFQKFREKGDWYSKFYGLEFIEEEILLGDPNVTRLENTRLKNRIKKYGHRKVGPVYLKNIGFKIWLNRSEAISTTGSNVEIPESEIASRKFEIYPQFPATIDGHEFRLDIAIILHRTDMWTDKVIESRKIALECDGYDYHSSPEQKRNDDIRTRKLKKSGWKEVLRYSGSELNGLKAQGEIDKLFEEIIEVLYI